MTIYAKLAKATSMVSKVPKNGYNSFHKYHYATESDVIEGIRIILNDVGLAFFTSVLDQERDGEFARVKMEFILADTETGDTIKSTYWGEGQDKGDKGFYKAYTGATKYFLMKTFLIPTGDDVEAGGSGGKRQTEAPPASNVSDIATMSKGKANAAQLKAVQGAIASKKLQPDDVAVVLQKFGATQISDLQAGDIGEAVKAIMNFKVAK